MVLSPPPPIVGPHVLILAGRPTSHVPLDMARRAFGGFLENSTVQSVQRGSVSHTSTCAEPASHLAKKVFPCGTTGGAHRRSSRTDLHAGRPRRRRRSSVRAQRSDGAQRDCIVMIRAVSYSDLSKSKTRSARWLITARSTERNVVQQGLRRRALRRRALQRRALRPRRAAVLSGPARHGSRSGSTSCREGNRACTKGGGFSPPAAPSGAKRERVRAQRDV